MRSLYNPGRWPADTAIFRRVSYPLCDRQRRPGAPTVLTTYPLTPARLPQPVVPQPPALAGQAAAARCFAACLRVPPAWRAARLAGGQPGSLPSRHALAYGGGWQALAVGIRARCEE